MSNIERNLPVVLSIAAALIYNDWPLGFVLNPKVAPIGLSSDLEAYNQPFNWFFIGSDIVSALLILYTVLFLMLRKPTRDRFFRWALVGLCLFSVMTAASAALPLDCSKHLQSCGFNPGQVLGVHDITSGLAALGLFIGMAATLALVREFLRRFQWNAVLLIAWSAWGSLFTLTPLPAVRHVPQIMTIGIIWEQVFLILSGIAVVSVVYCLNVYGLNRRRRK